MHMICVLVVVGVAMICVDYELILYSLLTYV